MLKRQPIRSASQALGQMAFYEDAAIGVIVCDGKNVPESLFMVRDNGCTLTENIMARLNITGVAGNERLIVAICTGAENPADMLEETSNEVLTLKAALAPLGVEIIDIILYNYKKKSYYSFAEEKKA